MAAGQSKSSFNASGARAGLTVTRIALGVFFLFEGWDKLPWMTDPGQLSTILHRWKDGAVPIACWYLEVIAIPSAHVFARLIFLGEVAVGLALIFGLWTRLAAAIAFLLVLNIHIAHSTIFQYGFLSKGDGLPVLGPLLALAIGGSSLPLSLNLKRRKNKF